MRINVAVPERHVRKPILDAALEATTRLNEELLRSGVVPLWDDAVNRVRWKPEPPGQEHFDHAALVGRRGWGDCDDLAPWAAASLRATGEDPEARAVVKRSGPKRWHAIVQRSDGSFDDPSLEAGMPGPGRRGIAGAGLPVMFQPRENVGAYIARPQLALRPVPSGYRGQPEAWQARADLPWHWQPGDSPADIAMVSLHQSPVSDQALVGACRGALRLGQASGFADDDAMERLEAITDACDGATWDDLADEYGEDHADAATELVGSFFGGIARGLKSVARKAIPITQTALPFIPGVGPVASQAFRMASPHLQRALASKRRRPSRRRTRRSRGLNLRCVPF